MQSTEQVIFTIVVIIILLIFIMIMFLIFLTKNNLRKNRLIFENERIKKEFQETLLKSRLEIQEYTLNYVSREIHDNIGQTLSLARLQINSGDHPEMQQETDELLGKAIADLRTLSHSLNTNYVKEKGLSESVKLLADRFKRTGKFNVVAEGFDDEIGLDDEKGLIVYRVIQEIFNNVLKHAGATEIKLNLENNGQFYAIRIKDNGKGFDTDNSENPGIGLKNISERIALIGGKFSIFSRLGEGTAVKIQLPNESIENESSIGR